MTSASTAAATLLCIVLWISFALNLPIASGVGICDFVLPLTPCLNTFTNLTDEPTLSCCVGVAAVQNELAAPGGSLVVCGCLQTLMVPFPAGASAVVRSVLSLSLGGGISDYYCDSVAIGAFNAMERGVLVSCSAGNDGLGTATLSNVAPWITTVGAGTLDRDFPH